MKNYISHNCLFLKFRCTYMYTKVVPITAPDKVAGILAKIAEETMK